MTSRETYMNRPTRTDNRNTAALAALEAHGKARRFHDVYTSYAVLELLRDLDGMLSQYGLDLRTLVADAGLTDVGGRKGGLLTVASRRAYRWATSTRHAKARWLEAACVEWDLASESSNPYPTNLTTQELAAHRLAVQLQTEAEADRLRVEVAAPPLAQPKRFAGASWYAAAIKLLDEACSSRDA